MSNICTSTTPSYCLFNKSVSIINCLSFLLFHLLNYHRTFRVLSVIWYGFLESLNKKGFSKYHVLLYKVLTLRMIKDLMIPRHRHGGNFDALQHSSSLLCKHCGDPPPPQPKHIHPLKVSRTKNVLVTCSARLNNSSTITRFERQSHFSLLVIIKSGYSCMKSIKVPFLMNKAHYSMNCSHWVGD